MPKRPGEMEIAQSCLQKDAYLSFIGHIETPFQTIKDCPRCGVGNQEIALVRLKPEFLPGLKSVETCSHVILFYWMHEAMRTLIQQCPRFAEEAHGTFALRSPNRPNPISMSVVELLEVTSDGLKIRNIDCLDGTPLLDIKPYFASSDAPENTMVGWFDKSADNQNG